MESNSHSFVVTIWTEEGSRPADEAQLRGHVTHAVTKARGPVKELTDILAFMVPYVLKLGVRLHARSRIALILGAFGRRRRRF